MANILSDYVIDNGLAAMVAEADQINVVSADPTTYTEATSTFSLGVKNLGVGAAVSGPAAGTPNGRKVTSAAIADGLATGNGTVTGWAIVDTVNMRLHANGQVTASQTTTAGNPFTLAPVDIVQVPNQ